MKVIARGNYENAFPMLVKCKRVVDEYGFSYGSKADFCGSTIEIEMTDIKKHKWNKYPIYNGTDYGFICPVCGKFVVVDENKIPKKVRNEAEEISVNSR